MKRENIYTEHKIEETNSTKGNISVDDNVFDIVKKTLKTGILFCNDICGSDFNSMKTVADVVINDFPLAKVFCYVSGSTKHLDLSPVEDFEIIDGKKFNIFGNLKKTTALQLAGTHYDLIIVFGNPENKHCKKILKTFNTKIKAGQAFENSDEYFDISIGTAGKLMNCETFYKELFNYLKLLKIDFSNNIN